jgi:C-terminal processing protease CtpA/Prc
MDGNVGDLEITRFPPVELGRPTAVAAMKFLENVDALIIDIRHNGAGNPSTIQLVCSHFFGEKTHLYSLYGRERNRTQEFWTLDSIGGKRRPDLPLFVLTSRHTFSGGEEFAYNLKTGKRATLIGETTGGGANPGMFFPLNPPIGMLVPTGRAINPVPGDNREGIRN